MKATLVVFMLACICSVELQAQRGLFWLGGFEWGGTVGSFNFDQNKNILVNKYITKDGDENDPNDDDDSRYRSGARFTLNTSLYYRLSRRLGFEAGLMNTHLNIPFRDQHYQQTHKIIGEYKENIGGNFEPCINYTTKYIAAHYYLMDRYGEGAQIYFGGGISFNSSTSSASTVDQSYPDQSTNENLIVNGHFTQNFYSPFLETGIFFYSPYKKARSFFGIKYSLAPILFSADYQNAQNGTVQYQDHLSINGSAITVSYKLGISLINTKTHSKYTTSHKHYSSKRSSEKAERNVLKAELLGCFGYDKPSKASFWMYHHKNRYFLEKLDSNLNRAFMEELNLKSDESGLGHHDWVSIKNVSVFDKLLLFTSSGNSESSEVKITAHQFLVNGAESKKAMTIFRLKGIVKSYMNIAWSPDSSKVCAVILQPKQKQLKSTRILIKTLDHNLNLLYSAEAELRPTDKLDPDEMYLADLTLTNKGEVFIMGEVKDKKNGNGSYGIWSYNPEIGKILNFKFDFDNISTLGFKNNDREGIAVVGFYNEVGKNSDSFPYKGILFGKINTAQMVVENVKQAEVPNSVETIGSSRAMKLKSVWLGEYKNNTILLSENQYFLGLFHGFNSILTSSIDNDGNVKYVTTIKKHQLHYGFGNTLPYSYFSWFNERKKLLNVIFNDRKANLSNEQNASDIKWMRNSKPEKISPVLASIDSLGNQIRKKLLPNDSSKTVWFPASSFRVNENQILLMGKKSGKYRVAKIKID